MNAISLRALLVRELNDLYSAELKLARTLPIMANAASSDGVRAVFECQLDRTDLQVERLRQILAGLRETPASETTNDANELIGEGTASINDAIEDDRRDSSLIESVQRVEQYEIAGYECASAFAEQLGIEDAATLLQQTLSEKTSVEKKLTEIATERVNEEALAGNRNGSA